MTKVPTASGPRGLAAEPARRVGKRWIAFIALANLGLYLGYFGPLTVLLPNQVQAVAGPGHKVAVLGWVTGIGAAVAMISNPVAGALSDRTTGRFGRRHPWTVCGALAGAAARPRVGLDRPPADRRRGARRGAGHHGRDGQRRLCADRGARGGLRLPFALTTPDPPLPRSARPPLAWRAFARSFWLSPGAHPDFAWAWLTRFAVNLGNAMALLYLLYFLRDRVHYGALFPATGPRTACSSSASSTRPGSSSPRSSAA